MKLFFVVMVLFQLAANFAHPITPTVIKNLHLGDYMFGVAYACMTGTQFLMSPFWGKLNTYLSSRKTLLICGAGYAVGQMLFGLSETQGAVIFARLFSGVFIAGVYTSFLTYIVNESPEEDRGKNLTVNATLQVVAGAFGYLVGGLLGVFSIAATFALQSICLALSGLLFFLVCKNDVKDKDRKLVPRQLARDANPFSAFLSSREFLTAAFAVLFAVNIFANIGYTAYDQCFNYYIKDQFGLSSAYNGIIKAAVAIISLIANSTICLWIIKKTRVERSIVLVLSCCTLSVLGIVLLDDIRPFLMMNLVFFAFNAVSIPVIQNMIAAKAGSGQSNLVMGFYNATKSLGGIIGALLAGFVYTFGAKLSFVLSCTAFAAATFIAFSYPFFAKRKGKA